MPKKSSQFIRTARTKPRQLPNEQPTNNFSRRTDPSSLGFATMVELPYLQDGLGQPQVSSA